MFFARLLFSSSRSMRKPSFAQAWGCNLDGEPLEADVGERMTRAGF